MLKITAEVELFCAGRTNKQTEGAGLKNESTLRVTLLIQSYGWHHRGRTSYWGGGTWLLVQTTASPTCGLGDY